MVADWARVKARATIRTNAKIVFIWIYQKVGKFKKVVEWFHGLRRK
jgi:transposase-like protein